MESMGRVDVHFVTIFAVLLLPTMLMVTAVMLVLRGARRWQYYFFWCYYC